MKTSHDVIYRCEPRFYLEQYFDAANRAEREIKGCGTVAFKVLESNVDGAVWSHVAETTERLNAPGPVRKLFGETTRMEEHATWRTDSNVIELEYLPDTMKSKMTIRSRIRAADAGDNTTRVTIDLDVQAKIFVVGSLIEKLAVKEMPKHITQDADYFNAHIAPR